MLMYIDDSCIVCYVLFIMPSWKLNGEAADMFCFSILKIRFTSTKITDEDTYCKRAGSQSWREFPGGCWSLLYNTIIFWST